MPVQLQRLTKKVLMPLESFHFFFVGYSHKLQCILMGIYVTDPNKEVFKGVVLYNINFLELYIIM